MRLRGIVYRNTAIQRSVGEADPIPKDIRINAVGSGVRVDFDYAEPPVGIVEKIEWEGDNLVAEVMVPDDLAERLFPVRKFAAGFSVGPYVNPDHPRLIDTVRSLEAVSVVEENDDEFIPPWRIVD